METVQVKNELIWPGSSACPGCGLMIAYRHIFRTLGKNTVVITTAGCGSVVAGYYPTTISKLPFYHCSFGTAAATAAGVKAGLAMMGKTKTNVLAWAGDGGTLDIGLQSLSGAAERNDDIIYVCYDNEAYMNTGVQRSSATPFGSWTTTTPSREDRPKKNMVAIVAAHEVPYIATACVSYPEDLEKKVRKAKGIKGFRFLHVLAPCPPGWIYASKDTIRLGRLAVLSRVFPLFEVIKGREYYLSPMGGKISVNEYLTSQGRFRGLQTKEIDLIQYNTDVKWTELNDLAGQEGKANRG